MFPTHLGYMRPMMDSSSPSMVPSLFRSASFRSPGNTPYSAASSASSVPQVPKRVLPQMVPMGCPTRRILVCPRNQGPGKMSALLLASCTISLRFDAQFREVLQVKSPRLMLSELIDTSIPLFSTEPIFRVTPSRPVDQGSGAESSRSSVRL